MYNLQNKTTGKKKLANNTTGKKKSRHEFAPKRTQLLAQKFRFNWSWIEPRYLHFFKEPRVLSMQPRLRIRSYRILEKNELSGRKQASFILHLSWLSGITWYPEMTLHLFTLFFSFPLISPWHHPLMSIPNIPLEWDGTLTKTCLAMTLVCFNIFTIYISHCTVKHIFMLNSDFHHHS